MAQLLVRNLEEDVKAELRRRARARGCSTEEEVRDILRDAVKKGPSVPLGTRLRSRFCRVGLDEEIPELRGQGARPAVLKP
ncbi:MAG: toxin-antitoxin system [Candidatus Riflebacteria bacterium]|nr:toxin-antitoxin system [Candidatus Riflebacteria bacterium]